jgi:hypothetical protein
MHALRVSSLPLLIFVLAIAGCGGSPAPDQPLVTAQPSEFLYVGTSQPGLLKFSVASDGSLQPANLGRSAPAVCSPELTAVPSQIFVFSRLCPFSPTETELRRLELTPDGNIASSTPPISFGPDLPSNTGFALSFLPDRDGKLGYAWSVALDGSQHVSPVQIDTVGHLTVKPDLGISFPFLDPIASRCSDSHAPDAVLHTADGLFLSVQDLMVCDGSDGPNVRDSLYALDSQSGAIGNLAGIVSIEFPPQSFFIAYNGALALAGDTHLPGEGTNKLQLLQISARGGVTQLQQCFSDHAACAHPDAGTFHPSGKWVFVADRIAGGIWTIPVAGNTLAPEKASFLSANLLGGMRFAFSSTGRYLYVAQWSDADPGQILAFTVDPRTGILIPVPGSPWSTGTVESITSMIDVAGSAR